MQVRCTFEVAQLCLIATAKSTCNERKDSKKLAPKSERRKTIRILEQDVPKYFVPFRLLGEYSNKMACIGLVAKRLHLKSIRFVNSFCTSTVFSQTES